MKAKQQIAPPENWQDFEELCVRLWEEIWQTDNIARNGRSGQKQKGVDLSAIPAGKDGYYGVQCKAKDSLQGKVLTIAEIDDELKKAKNFKPELKRFIIATTAPKDTTIEEYVREKNLDNLKKGLFEIQLCSWEEIERLMSKHPNVHSWYLDSKDYGQRYSATVSVGDSDHITIYPQYEVKEKPMAISRDAKRRVTSNFGLPDLSHFAVPQYVKPTICKPINKEMDLSACPIVLSVENKGVKTIEEATVEFNIDSDGVKIFDTNIRKSLNLDIKTPSSVFVNDNGLSGRFKTGRIFMDKKWNSDEIFIQPTLLTREIKLNWNLFADELHTSGTITIDVQPMYESWKISMDEDLSVYRPKVVIE